MGAAVKFSVVGVLGFVVQLVTVGFLSSRLRWPWLPATLVAVEAAIVHNYIWHVRWTWKDRGAGFAHWTMFASFHALNGVTSLFGNVVLVALLIDRLHLSIVVANVVAVLALSLVNFLAADRWVFAPMLLVLLAPAPASAEPSADTLAAWAKHVSVTEASLGHAGAIPRDRLPQSVAASGETIDVGEGTISDWRGSIFVRGVTVDALLERLQHPGTPPPQEDVVASRVIARSPDHLRVYMRLVRHAIVTVSYDTEHDMTFTRQSATLATARSVATSIQEVGGGDHGFLWRLHSYWRYEAVGDGVLVSVRSLTLSRDVPMLIKPIAGRVVPRIARESMVRTLEALKKYVEQPLG